MSEAGHYEALRKERILQRKREWDRLSGSAGINTPRTDQQFLSDANNQIVQKHPQSAYTQGMGPSYEHELRGRYLPALPPINSARYNHLYSSRQAPPLTASTWKFVERDLFNKAKVLRNNNIVMGPMSAFEREYKKSAYMNPSVIY